MASSIRPTTSHLDFEKGKGFGMASKREPPLRRKGLFPRLRGIVCSSISIRVDSYFIRQVMLKSRSIFPSSLGRFLSLIHRQLVALSRKEMKCSNPAGEPIKASAFRTVKGSKTFFWLSKLESGLGAIKVDRKDNLPRPISIIHNRIPSKQRGEIEGVRYPTITSPLTGKVKGEG